MEFEKCADIDGFPKVGHIYKCTSLMVLLKRNVTSARK